MMVGCTLRDVWEEVRDATITLLGGVTFADLAQARRRTVGRSCIARARRVDRGVDSGGGRRDRP